MFMMTARVTDGVKPSIAAKASMTGRLTSAPSLRRFMQRSIIAPTSSETCIPETAITCAMPVTDSSFRVR